MSEAKSVFGEQVVTVLTERCDDSLPIERVDHSASVVNLFTIGRHDTDGDKLLQVPENGLVTDAELALNCARCHAAGVLGEDADDRPSNRIGSEHLYRLCRCVRQRRLGICITRHSFIVPQTCLIYRSLPFNGRLMSVEEIDQKQTNRASCDPHRVVPHMGDASVSAPGIAEDSLWTELIGRRATNATAQY